MQGALTVYLVEAGKNRKRSTRTGRLHFTCIEHEKLSFDILSDFAKKRRTELLQAELLACSI